MVRENKLFKLDVQGFEDISLGNIAAKGLTDEFLQQDLCIEVIKSSGGDVPVHLNSDPNLPIVCSRPPVAVYDANDGNAQLFVGEPLFCRHD